MDPVEAYRKRKDELLSAMRSPLFDRYFGGSFGSNIRRAISIMLRDLDLLVSNRRPAPSRDDARFIATTSRALTDFLMREPLTPFITQFAMGYSEVLKNWNDMTIRAQDIDHYSRVIARLAEDYLTMHELVQVLRSFVPRMERLMRYTPPAFELSRHYLEVVLKKHASGEPINKYEEAILKRKRDQNVSKSGNQTDSAESNESGKRKRSGKEK